MKRRHHQHDQPGGCVGCVGGPGLVDQQAESGDDYKERRADGGIVMPARLHQLHKLHRLLTFLGTSAGGEAVTDDRHGHGLQSAVRVSHSSSVMMREEDQGGERVPHAGIGLLMPAPCVPPPHGVRSSVLAKRLDLRSSRSF